jgi:hypothetical protein
LFVPLLCLICMFFLSRHEASSTRSNQRKLVVDT